MATLYEQREAGKEQLRELLEPIFSGKSRVEVELTAIGYAQMLYEMMTIKQRAKWLEKLRRWGAAGDAIEVKVE